MREETSRGARKVELESRLPALECDLVLKGGVTSGVLYPPAILTLAKTFRFRAVGGASAGAIAAALAAAAEMGRQSRSSSPDAGFRGLHALNRTLASPGFLVSCLPPKLGYRAVLRLVLTFGALSRWLARSLGSGLGRIGRVPAALLAAIFAFPLSSALGGAAASTLFDSFIVDQSRGVGFVEVVMRIVVASLGIGAGALISLLVRLRRLRRSGFGICAGSAGPDADFSRPAELALTDWLHYWINRLAGRGPDDAPVTFRELSELHGIELKLMSANLTLAQAFVLPLQRGSLSFYFKAHELAALFPKAVSGYLESWARAHPPTKLNLGADSGVQRFPFGLDMPVVVAARLSLSFPILLSAVRLYSFPTSAYERSKAGTATRAGDEEEHWFSDGGIASNFPIHLFDSWLPSRPTFGITLYDSPVASVLDQRESDGKVLLPKPADFELARPPRLKIGRLSDFLRAVFQTAQSHRDVALTSLPGCRERVVQVFLDSEEGGLNLSMPPSTIERIQERGRQAARALLERYVEDEKLSEAFQEHVWVRTLVLLGQLEKQFGRLRDGSPGPWRERLREEYRALLAAQRERGWYRAQSDAWAAEAERRVAALLMLIESWEAQQCFSSRPPRPEGALRITSET